jgi:hypothetical protein
MSFYVMKIDFIGYDDDGKPKNIPNTTRYIPFLIANMEFDVGHKGATYKIKGIPYNHTAQTEVDVVIQNTIELAGSTLDEIFVNGTTKFPGGLGKKLTDQEKTYVDKGGHSVQNFYSFEFRDNLGSSKVLFKEDKVDEKSVANTRVADRNTQPSFDPKNKTFKIQAGTRITDLINNIVQQSSFIRDQVTQDSANASDVGNLGSGAGSNQPLRMIKVIPEVEYTQWDPKTNMWGRKIKYVVVPYEIPGSTVPGFPSQPVTNAVKRYKWVFTGQNKDVIDLKLNFKSAYFNLKNIKLTGVGVEPAIDSNNKTNPPRYRSVTGLADQRGVGPHEEDIKEVLAAEELFRTQFNVNTDNLKLDLTIVGDPAFIQQDTLVYGANGDKSAAIYPDGTVNFVHKKAFFYLDFKAAWSDYDISTGLFGGVDGPTNVFNGYYGILMVTSEFKGGKFIQKLQTYRAMKQSTTSSSAR